MVLTDEAAGGRRSCLKLMLICTLVSVLAYGRFIEAQKVFGVVQPHKSFRPETIVVDANSSDINNNSSDMSLADCNKEILILKERIRKLEASQIDAECVCPNANEFPNVGDDNEIVLHVKFQHGGVRHRRFLGSVISSVSGFLVRSGIWRAFKVGCAEFLKFTGGALIGEAFDWFASKSRDKRSVGYVPTFNMSYFKDGCHSTFSCGFDPDKLKIENVVLEHLPSIPKPFCSDKLDSIINPKFSNLTVIHPRDRCFIDELNCTVFQIHPFDGLVAVADGCGGCPSVVKLPASVITWRLATVQSYYDCISYNLNLNRVMSYGLGVQLKTGFKIRKRTYDWPLTSRLIVDDAVFPRHSYRYDYEFKVAYTSNRFDEILFSDIMNTT